MGLRSRFTKPEAQDRRRQPAQRYLTSQERARAGRTLSDSELEQLEADDLGELLAATNAKRRARGKTALTSEAIARDLSDQSPSGPPQGTPHRWDAL